MTKSGGKSLAVRVAEALRKEIIEERLKPGDKLHSESELMEQFKVSRTTVREAMKLLKAENIVEIKRGNGTFVSDKTGITEDPLGLRFSEKPELLAELLEARIVIEPRLMELAVFRATPEDIECVRHIIERMEQKEEPDAEYTALDVEFHTQIAKCAHNKVLETVVPVICESIQKGYLETVNVPGSFERALDSHKTIYKAMVTKDLFLAQYEAERHIRQTLGDVKKQRKELKEEKE